MSILFSIESEKRPRQIIEEDTEMADKRLEEIAISYLAKKGKPVPVSELIDHILRYKNYEGKTPRNTVSSLLSKSRLLRKMGGMYAIRD